LVAVQKRATKMVVVKGHYYGEDGGTLRILGVTTLEKRQTSRDILKR